jgi:flagellar protein FliS
MEGKIDAYRRADTVGKSQLDLIIMVYDGALKALKEAKAHFQRDQAQAGYEQMQKGKRFITHLYTTLDTEKGGEVAANLGRMYVYVLSQCYVIEATKNADQLVAIIEMLSNLRSGWIGLKEQQLETAESEVAGESADTPAGTVEQFVTTG